MESYGTPLMLRAIRTRNAAVLRIVGVELHGRGLCHWSAAGGSEQKSAPPVDSAPMRIWFSDLKLEHIVNRGANTLVEHLGIQFTEVGEDYLRATMPVDRSNAGRSWGCSTAAPPPRWRRPIGSFAANMCVDHKRLMCVGQEINANHLRPVASGLVDGDGAAVPHRRAQPGVAHRDS